MNLNPYSLPTFSAAVLFGGLGLYVFFHDLKSPTNRLFAIWCFLTFHWQISWTVLFNVSDKNIALILAKIGYSGIVFLPILWYHFVNSDLKHWEVEKRIILWGYLASVLFLSSIWFGHGFLDGLYHYDWGFYPKAGQPFHGLFLVFIAVLYIRCQAIFLWAMKATKGQPERHIQVKYLMLAIGIYGLAATDFLVNYGVKFYPLGILPISAALLLIAYTIVRFRLLAIAVFARRAGLLFLVYCFLLLWLVPILYMAAKFAETTGSILSALLVGALLSGFVLSTGPVIYAYFVRTRAYFHEDMMAGLTHELKSPLAAIEGALEVLNSRSAKGVGENDIKYIDMINRNTARLRQFVESLLQVLRGQGSTPFLANVNTELAGLCNSCGDVMRPLAQARGITLEVDVQPIQGEAVSCDPAKISIVISNLLSNSLKFTDRGFVRLTAINEHNYIEISVEDSGTGISAQEIPYVFDRFFQGEAGRTRKGTGIGLTIAKLWVEAHGGDIHVSSGGEGQGSRFWFTLPKR